MKVALQTDSSTRVNRLLAEWGEGDEQARDALIPLIYDELRRVARRHLWRERPDHTLQSAGLVNEAFLRLVRQEPQKWQNRAHFFGVILPEKPETDLVALDAALEKLAVLDPEQSHLIELRFFGGLSIEETAVVLGVSPATVKSDWSTARAWLRREMREAEKS